MTRKQAAKLANDLRAEGYSWKEIGLRLAKEGIVSQATGKPLSSGGTLLFVQREGGETKKKKTAKKKTKRKTRTNDIATIRAIVQLDVSEKQRLRLIEAVLGL